MPSDGEDVVVEPGVAITTVNVAVAPAGVLEVQVDDARLPSPPTPGAARDAAAEAYGAAVRITVTDANGRVVAEVTGLEKGERTDAAYLTVLPGRYRVRYASPAGTTEAETAVPAGAHGWVALPTAPK